MRQDKKKKPVSWKPPQRLGGAGRSEEADDKRSVSQCEPAPGATVASGARYFYFRLCPLAMAALEQAAVQMVENARTVKSVAPRCRAAKLVPPLSTPDQLTCQDQ